MTCFDEASTTSGYARYLAAKTTVDDRALNRQVLAELCRLMPAGAPRVLEVGAGLGTMVARLLDWGVVSAGEYVLLDADRQLLAGSRRWLHDWAAARGVRSDLLPDGLQVGDLRVRLVHAELGGYLEAAARGAGRCADRQRRPGPGGRAGRPARIVAAACPRRRLLVHDQLRRREHLRARPPARRPGHAGLPPRHGRAHPLRPACRGKPHGPPPVSPPAGCGGACAGGGVVGLGRVPGPGRDLPGRRGLLPAQHPEYDPGRIAESPGPGGTCGPGRLAGRALSAAGAGELVYIAHQLDFVGRSPG